MNSESIFKPIPDPFFRVGVRELHDAIRGPALFFLQGEKSPPLLISTLLHGDEHTGFLALQKWLEPFASKKKIPKRSLWIFIGNTLAAKSNLRRMEFQQDFNRIWKDFKGSEGALALEVVNRVTRSTLFSAVDIHNNSGKNPYYGCTARWEKSHVRLASLFSKYVVHAEQPQSTLAHLFSSFCPSVTIECGASGCDVGTQCVVDYLNRLEQSEDFNGDSTSFDGIEGFQTVAHIKIPESVSISFGNELETSDLALRPDIDSLNFMELKPGTILGKYRCPQVPFVVQDASGNAVNVISFNNGIIQTEKTIVPAMFTTRERAIREDCLGYVMVRKLSPVY